MKKILIAGFTKIAYMPYLNFYLEALKREKVKIHVISWRRDKEEDIKLSDDRIIVHEFNQPQQDEVAKTKKINSFIKYRSFVKSKLKTIHFDRIIVLHTLPAVLIADTLLKKYKDKFILDYRDYTYEGFKPFKWIIGKLIRASRVSFVSSNAFREALPQLDKVISSHNLLTESLMYRDVRPSHERKHQPIRVAFWGYIRHFDINYEIVRKLGNDLRFELHYYGREQETAQKLKSIVREHNLINVFFHGTYHPSDRYEFAKNTDLLHNMYENNAGTKRAIGNKYYDGIIFRIPQICNIGSYMGQQVLSEGVGIMFDPYSINFSNELATYYNNIDWEIFNDNCDSSLSKVITQYEAGKKAIVGLLDD